MRVRICDAIRSRHLLEFRYDGYSRVVEPYVYGESAKGKRLLRAYQIEGTGFSRDEHPWRLFDQEKITGLRASVRTFQGMRPDYNPNDPAMEVIFCRL